MGGAKSVNIKSYKRRRQINIGMVLFSIVPIYLIVTMLIYATGKKAAAYEVREGSILDDRFYTGIALRDEKVVTAQEGGYINYLQGDCVKIGKGMQACVITSSPLAYKAPCDTAGEARPYRKRQELAAMVQDFNADFSPGEFSCAYAFKSELEDFLFEGPDNIKLSEIDDIIEEGGMSAAVYDAPYDGIMLRYADGYEDVTFDSLKVSDFDEGAYKASFIRDNGKVEKGGPAYKIAADEKWEIVVRLDEKTAAGLIGLSAVDTRINKDNQITRARILVSEKDGELYARLKYNDSMVRYAKGRFLNVQIILKDVKGLKVPKSSLTRQDFYVIPKEYIKKEKDGVRFGVNLQQEGGQIKFTPARIYKATDEGMVYIGKEGFPPGAVIVSPDFEGKMKIKESAALTGVFNVNKGYAEFKWADVLGESGDYCIVGAGDVYGIHNYDHIALDASKVSEGEIVF